MSINLVLSGGGARGIAHLGVIKVLQETGVIIKRISGVSSGASMGAFIAAGYTPEDVLKFFVENKLIYKVRPVFNAGIFRMTKWEKLLLNSFPKNSFEDLKIPLIINATDINEGKTVYFSSGQLVLPLLASASIPGFFEPITINGRQLVDGGVLANLPVEPFMKYEEKIVASFANPFVFEEQIKSTFKILERTVNLSLKERTDRNKARAHLLFEPPELSKYSTFALDDAKDIFEIGYRHASSKRDELEKLAG